MIKKYELVISGRNPEYFLKKLIVRKVHIYDLKKERKKLYIIVDFDGLEKIKAIKTSYKYKIINSYGMAKVEYLIKKYFLFFACCVFGVIINIFLSNIIFDVEVVHSNSNIRDIIYSDLKTEGISKYRFKVSYKKKEEIVKNIVAKETDDIEWMEIEEVGTKYIVRVEQRKKNKLEEECRLQNVVAKKDAMILQIEATSGEVVKKKLDYVKKGEVIISGVIHNKEDIVSYRCARGKVFGEVWYQVVLELPKIYKEEVVTGNKRSQFEIQFLNNLYTIFNDYKTYRREVRPILSSNLLPISFNYSTYLETDIIYEAYNIDNVSKKALEVAEAKLKNKLGEEDEILSKKVLKKIEKESKIIVEVFIKVKEDITDVSDIVIENEEVKE